MNCIFHLENNQSAVYFAGQDLRGQVELVLDDPKTIRCFSLKIYGFAFCRWTETREETTGHGSDQTTRNVTHYYEGKDVYLNSVTYLFGSEGGSSQQMPAGTHRYDFQVHLPENLPASFEAKRGHIRYSIEAKMDIPWKFNKEFKLGFNVVRNDDLSLYPELQHPMGREIRKTFCCLCCASGPLLVQASIPRQGFGLGEVIPLRVEYINKSEVDVIETQVKVVKVIRYNSQTPTHKTKFESDIVGRRNSSGVGASSSKVYELPVVVPQILVASNDRFCRVVQVTYELKVVARVNSCARNVELSFPFALFSNFSSSQALPAGQSSSVGSAEIFQPTAPPLFETPEKNINDQVPITPPPSFEDAVKMPKSNLNTSQGYEWNMQPPSAPHANTFN